LKQNCGINKRWYSWESEAYIFHNMLSHDKQFSRSIFSVDYFIHHFLCSNIFCC